MSSRKAHDAEIYHQIFREVVEEHFGPARLVAEIIKAKLEEQGLDASKNGKKVRALAEKILKAGAVDDQDDILVEFDDGSFGASKITLCLTSDDVAIAGKRLTDSIEESSKEIFRALSRGAVRRVLHKPDGRLMMLSSERDAFMRRLAHQWRDPFRLLDVHIALCGEIGNARNEWLRTRRKRSKDIAIVDVVTRLHARGLQVAQEVQTLLRGGFADGALSRWRTIHELTVTAMFIASHDPIVATRFIDHLTIDSARSARQYAGFATVLGHRKISRKELVRLDRLEKELKHRYGDSFLEEYGWAASALNNKRPTFAAIEQAVDLDHLRPYFRLASSTVHAGAKGTYFRIGLITQDEIILAGATNYGLEEPAQLVALSLAQLSAVLLSLHPNTDSIVWTDALLELAGRVGKSFCSTGRQIKKAEMQRRSTLQSPVKRSRVRPP